MTNEEAIKEIQDASDYEVRHGDIEHHHEDIMRRVEAFEQAVNALQKYKTWIPVSERLPEESVDVICCTNAKEVFIASYLGKLDDGTECFDDDNGMMCEGDVVAWMPLPKPYKAEMEGIE